MLIQLAQLEDNILHEAWKFAVAKTGYPKEKVILAGGAIRDHLLGFVCKDYDIFLLGKGEKKPVLQANDGVNEVTMYSDNTLTTVPLTIDPMKVSFKITQNTQEMFVNIPAATAFSDWPVIEDTFVGEPYGGIWPQKHYQFGNKEMQVMNEPSDTIEGLLQRFDWNVCCAAYDGTNLYQLEDIQQLKYLELVDHQHFGAHRTWLRGWKFSQKYKLPIADSSYCELLGKMNGFELKQLDGK